MVENFGVQVMRNILVCCIFALSPSLTLADVRPVELETVLDSEEVSGILSEKNVYFRHNETSGVRWDRFARQYGSHLLAKRTQYFSLADVKKRTLHDGFATRYQVQGLIRAALDPHIAFGQILPGISVTVGDGAAPISTANAFNGLFGFLFPQNWMNLKVQNRQRDIMKYLFIKTALDEANNAELAYIDQHHAIMDFEIKNYYLVHGLLTTRLLENTYSGVEIGEDTRAAISTFRAMVGTIASEMSLDRGRIKFGFDSLALIMALEKDAAGAKGIEKINIYNLADFPERVEQLSALPEPLKSKDTFVQEAVNRSIELRAIGELYKISKLNVGITALSSMTSNRENSGTREPRFGFSFSYATLPRIFKSVSGQRTAEIDVQQEYHKLMNTARRAHDLYSNNLGLYTEASLSLELNRKAFLENLSQVFDHGSPINYAFQESIQQMVDAELKVNLALHNALKGLAIMRRLLLADEEQIMPYLPEDEEVEKAFTLLHKEGAAAANPYNREARVRAVRKTKELVALLNDSDREFVRNLVRDNIGYLLHSKAGFIKSARFYRALRNYVEEERVDISEDQLKSLIHKSKRIV